MQRLHPALDEGHTLRQTTRLMIDTRTYTITVTRRGQPTATLTIHDILNAVRDGHNTKTTTLAAITAKQPLSPETRTHA